MKRIAKALLSVLLVTGISACGKGNKPSDGSDVTASGSNEGKVLNIYSWDEEFITLMENHYPGYEKTSENSGRIGDVTVKHIIAPEEEYQGKLNDALSSGTGNDQVDLFLVNADWAVRYTGGDSPAALDVMKDLGLTEADLADQYPYTKEAVKGDDALRAVTWKVSSGALFYRRDVALEVFGTDDPLEIGPMLRDWNSFREAAAKLKTAGYAIACSTNDTYPVYIAGASGPWVSNDTIKIDKNMEQWVADSKALIDAGEINTFEIKSEEWYGGFRKDGKVFAYFGPAEMIGACMERVDDSIAGEGGWAVVEGPQSYVAEGKWICGARGTDNPTLVSEIMKTLTCNETVMKDILKTDKVFVNRKSLMDSAGSGPEYALISLGGQNPFSLLNKGAEAKAVTASPYDYDCREQFRRAMNGFFDGTYNTYAEALDAFYQTVQDKHPELTR